MFIVQMLLGYARDNMSALRAGHARATRGSRAGSGNGYYLKKVTMNTRPPALPRPLTGPSKQIDPLGTLPSLGRVYSKWSHLSIKEGHFTGRVFWTQPPRHVALAWL